MLPGWLEQCRLNNPVSVTLSVSNRDWIIQSRNSDGVVVKFLLAEQKARDSIPNLTTTISEIYYLLLPSHKLAEIHVSPKRRKSSEQ